ncbi:MAG: FG-GAP-like repeat-containing protein [Candidatus Eisenbacteria bacterium]
MGRWTMTAGDFNGDGYSDVITSIQGHRSGAERLGGFRLYFGNEDGEFADSVEMAGGQVDADFGVSLGTAGDINEDGYDDIVIGAASWDVGLLADAGRVFVYYGNDSGVVSAPQILDGVQAGAHFGYQCVLAGDVNGDGHADVIIGSPDFADQHPREGKAELYLGSDAGLVPSGWSYAGGEMDAELGRACGPAGDVDGDGFDDVLIGVPGIDADRGRLYLFRGRDGGLYVDPSKEIVGGGAGYRFGAAVFTAGDLNADGLSDVIVGAPGGGPGGEAYVFRGTDNGALLLLTAILESPTAGAGYGAAVSTAGDINADGFADLIIGAPEYPRTGERYGAAFVHLGSESGVVIDPILQLDGDWQGGRFGISVAPAGDFNGDGYGDIVTGNNAVGQSSFGRIYLYPGSGLLPKTTADWTRGHNSSRRSFFGFSIAPAGDVNGDGFTDVLISAPSTDESVGNLGKVQLFLGAEGGLTANPVWEGTGRTVGDGYGLNAVGIGDINADGYSDFAVTAPMDDEAAPNAGAVYLYLGDAVSPAMESYELLGESAGDRFGSGIASTGTADQDWRGDFIVGADSYGADDTGRAYLYRGNFVVGPDLMGVLDGRQAGEHFGAYCGFGGDVNRDGFWDFVVGAPDYDDDMRVNVGRVELFYGNGTGIPSSSWETVGKANYEQIGSNGTSQSGFTGVDFNADGYSDLVFRARRVAGDDYILMFRGGSVDPVFVGEIPTPQNGSAFGTGLSSAGDVDGDGYVDLVVGAPEYDLGGGNQPGAAFIYRGVAGVALLETTPAWSVIGDQAGSAFGWEVTGIGDVNGDGFADVGIAAITYDGVEEDEGRVFVYHGNSGGGPPTLIRQLQTIESVVLDVNGRPWEEDRVRLEVEGRTTRGSGRVRAEYQIAPLGTAIDDAPVQFGEWTRTSTPGVNGSAVTIQEVATGLSSSTAYHWRIRTAASDPFFPWTRWHSLSLNGVEEADFRTLTPEAAADVDDVVTTGEFFDLAVVPNPVHDSAMVQLRVPTQREVSMELVTVDGRVVDRLELGRLQHGTHIVEWNSRAGDQRLPSGVYWMRIRSGDGILAQQRVVLLR